jgi:hypothetical protein
MIVFSNSISRRTLVRDTAATVAMAAAPVLGQSD